MCLPGAILTAVELERHAMGKIQIIRVGTTDKTDEQSLLSASGFEKQTKKRNIWVTNMKKTQRPGSLLPTGAQVPQGYHAPKAKPTAA